MRTDTMRPGITYFILKIWNNMAKKNKTLEDLLMGFSGKKKQEKNIDEFFKNEVAYSQEVWRKADQTDLYRDILFDLTEDPQNPNKGEIIMAKNADDFAKVIIGTNFLWKYIVQLVNDIISTVGQNQWWEESEDKIRDAIWLAILKRYTKKIQK